MATDRKFYEMTDNEGERDIYEGTDNISYMLYIAESRRHECPKLQIKSAGEEIQALTQDVRYQFLNEDL